MTPSKAKPYLDKAVGPIPGKKKPVRSGLSLRVSPKTGQVVWSYFGGMIGKRWFGYADTKERAMDKYRRGKVSKHQSLDWYGTAKP